MSDYGLPVLYALFVWWFSTGAILYLDGLPARTFRWSMAGATVVLGLALYGLSASSTDASVAGAYVAFSCGLAVWGWQEMAFLMGFVTGPRPHPCPTGCTEGRRFVRATQAILYHELAIAAAGVAVLALTWGAPNQVGAATFLILWVMRLSAKLNLFLGVPNSGEDFLPEHLGFLKSYLRKRAMNALFPVSITLSTAAVALIAQRGLGPDAGAFEVAGSTFLATLLALAVLEHWFLVLPFPVASLWSWGFRSRAPETVLEAGPLATFHPAQATTPRRQP